MKKEEMAQNEMVAAAELRDATRCEKNAEEKMEKLENSVNSVIEENGADGLDGHDGHNGLNGLDGLNGTDEDTETGDDAENADCEDTETSDDAENADGEDTETGDDAENADCEETETGDDAENADCEDTDEEADEEADEERGDERCSPAVGSGSLPTSGDEHIDAVLLQMAQEQAAGAWSEATITLLRRALNYDNDVAKARHEGEVAGRNVRIREFLIERREPEGIYNLSGGGSALAHDVPAERLGGLAAAERPNIWQRGGERRERRN